MALDQSALLEFLARLKLTDVTDRIRSETESLYQELIEAEATAFIGAAPFERSNDRTSQRNGTRPRTLTTTAGDLNLRIPKLRAGSFFPALLERRRRVDQALYAVVMEAYLHGVSTRKVDDLVKALGADTGISKSEVSRICADLDHEVGAFRDRDLSAMGYPYVFLDATYGKARVNHRVVSQAVVVAFGVAADGRREVLGFDVGDSENEAFWTGFLRSLKARGPGGVKLVISDAHTGLKKAIGVVFQGAADLPDRASPSPACALASCPCGSSHSSVTSVHESMIPHRDLARERPNLSAEERFCGLGTLGGGTFRRCPSES
jgi:putative transposase